jgi:hypothetical protein
MPSLFFRPQTLARLSTKPGSTTVAGTASLCRNLSKKPECQPGKFAGLPGIETGFAIFKILVP